MLPSPPLPKSVPFFPFRASAENTVHAVLGVPTGGDNAAALSCFSLAALSFAALRAFCFSVTTFLFGFGFALPFFLGLGFGLIRGFASDWALGTLFASVSLLAGFLAALVAEVVGDFRRELVVRPVWALGREAGFVAYVRWDIDVEE